MHSFPCKGGFNTKYRKKWYMYEMKLLMEPTENSEKAEPQMEFEPTILRDPVGCSNH